MAETHEDITLNDDSVSLREWIAKHSDHVDEGVHQVQATVDRLESMLVNVVNQVSEMHAELEAARPIIEKWTHSKLVKLAAGQFPWAQNATGGNHDHPA